MSSLWGNDEKKSTRIFHDILTDDSWCFFLELSSECHADTLQQFRNRWCFEQVLRSVLGSIHVLRFEFGLQLYSIESSGLD